MLETQRMEPMIRWRRKDVDVDKGREKRDEAGWDGED